MDLLIYNELKDVKIDEDNLYKIISIKIQEQKLVPCDIEQHTKYCNDIKNLLKEKSIDDIVNEYKEIYTFMLNSMYIEMTKTITYIKQILFNYEYKNIDILKNDTKFLERVYIRIILLKYGWLPSSIEKFISRHYSDIKVEGNIYLKYYICFQEIIKVNNILLKGRPKLPNSIKNIVKKYKEIKNKNRMIAKYTMIKHIKGLFQKDELNKIRESLLNNNEDRKNENLLKKIDILEKYS